MQVVVLTALMLVMANNAMALEEAPHGEEFRLKTSDGKVEVIFDRQFGGAITKIYDRDNFGEKNLIDNDQAGAMFQLAFWQLPYHSVLDGSKVVPPGCVADRSDMKLKNPTQAGFVGDGWAGNPIGILGTNKNIADENEFIRYENGGTVHFKSKLIRYDYCMSGMGAPVTNETCDNMAKTSYLNNPEAVCRDLWDTDFYLEQWAYFHPSLQRTLVLKNRLVYAGVSVADITTRQWPVIFGFDLTRVAYRKNGEMVVAGSSPGVNFDPSMMWSAILGTTKNAGIGLVYKNKVPAMLGRNIYQFEWSGTQLGIFNGEQVTAFHAGSGVPDIRKMARLDRVYLLSEGAVDAHVFRFESGGLAEWESYHPIGSLDLIEMSSEAILLGRTDIEEEIDGSVDIAECKAGGRIAGWTKDTGVWGEKLMVEVEIFPISRSENRVISRGEANIFRQDLAGGICKDGRCAFDFKVSTVPDSSGDDKFQMNVWGVGNRGQRKLATKTFDRCADSLMLKPGDADGNRLIDMSDFAIWRSEYFDLGKKGEVVKDNWMADFDRDKRVTMTDYVRWLDVCQGEEGRCRL